MLTPESRKTMNERVTTGNLSFSSTREPSPTQFGDGPPSPCRTFSKSSVRSPVRPYRRISKKHSVQAKAAWLFPKSLINKVSAQNTKQAPIVPPQAISINPLGFPPFCRRSLCHDQPSSFRRYAPKKRSIDSTFSYYHEINPLQLAHSKSPNDQLSFQKNGSMGPRTSRRLLSRSSRLLIQHPIQGFGK